MAYNSKYTGAQVEAKLDAIAGKADKTYVDAEVAAAKDYASGELSAVREDLEAADQDLKLYVDEQTLASKDYTDFKTKDKYVKPSSGIPASDLAPDVFLQGEKGDKGDKGDTGATGPQGPQGVSVSSVAQTTTSTADGGTNVVTVTLSNGTKSTFNVKNGSKGSNGTNGTNGATFTPSVDSAGNLSWTNNGGLSNPPTVNIKGPKGDKGDSGSGGGSSSGGAYAQVNHGTADTTFTLTPNTFHVWDEVASLTLTLGSETAGVANEYVFQFTSGSTATSLTLPDDIKWANDSAPTIAENMIYQISVLNGLATALEFSNKKTSSGNPIVFYVDDTPYDALDDMTWETFIDSDMNPDIYYEKMFIKGYYGSPKYAYAVYSDDDIEYAEIMTDDYGTVNLTDLILPINYIAI